LVWFQVRSKFKQKLTILSKKKLQQARSALEKEMTGGLKNPLKFIDLTDEKLASIDGLFIPGGHAPLSDLWNDANLGNALSQKKYFSQF
jgi:putative intracellular protease/amidase